MHARPKHRPAAVLLLLVCALTLGLLPGLRARAFGDGQPASLVLGQRLFTTQNYPVAERLTSPEGIAVDPATGRVFVADRLNNRVLWFDSAANLANGAPAAGVLGQPDLFGGAPATSASGMHGPVDVAIDAAGRLWVVDRENHRVLRFDNAASLASGAPADGVLGQPDFTSGARTTGAAGLRDPRRLTLDADGHLWVADKGNFRVLRFDNAASKPNGAPADGVLGQSDFAGSAIAPITTGTGLPDSLALDATGRLWVSDAAYNRVLRFDNAASKPNGAPADGVLGQSSLSAFDTPPTLGGWSLSVPQGLAADAAGRLWVADAYHQRVLRFDNAAAKANGTLADGVLGQADFSGSTPATTAQGMNMPGALALDPVGRLWVADTNNRRVLRFDSAAAKANGAPADGVLGQERLTSGSDVMAETLTQPLDVAVDPLSGKVFVADATQNRVLRFASHASLVSGASAEAVLGQPDLTSSGSGISAMSAPSGLAFDPQGRLWVADCFNNRVLRFDNAATRASGAPADAVLGQATMSASGFGSSATRMHAPQGLAVDSAGRLWVADSSNHRVLRFDAAASKPNGASADAVLGQPGFNSNAAVSNLTAMTMLSPAALAVDSAGKLWVADSVNQRVLRFDNAAGKSNGAAADAVLGQPDFTTRASLAGALGMSRPQGLALDSAGTLWVSDGNQNRVLRFDSAAAKANGAPADGVLGQPDLTSTTAATTATGMHAPRGMALDSAGNLWVADTNNRRVLMFDRSFAPTSTPTPTDTPTSTPTDTPTDTPTSTPTGPADLPDLTITELLVRPQTSGCPEGPLGLRVLIANIGSADAGPFAVTANGETQTVAGLAAGQSLTLWFSSYVYRLLNTVTVDSANQVVERDEGNNQRAEDLPLTTPCPTPTNTPTPSPTSTSVGPGSLPDLTITAMLVSSRTNQCPQGPLGLLVWVANIGSADAGPFAVTANGATHSVAGLAAGQSLAVWFPSYVYGNPNSATVDSAGQVAESDEGNNQRTELVPIPTPLYCPSPTPSVTTPATPTVTPIVPGWRLYLPLVRR